ncbi:MAG: hypothetical protein IPH12_07045 [Saprospirales bacterium]|nr:hypothetical protein [Saprospirales bacterium]
MRNIFNSDFQDFIRALNQCQVAYILVGGYSVILHGHARTTGDLDIWVKPTKDNYQLLAQAFQLFGMPVFDMSADKFLHTDQYDVFIFGVPPVSIEVLTIVKGMDFDEAFVTAQWFEIGDGLQVRTLSIADLLKAKKAAGRLKDLDDIEHLTP